jgi:hypothetical protein
MERSASAHLENDQGARLPWLRLLAPAGKSSVFARLICCPIFCRFVFLRNASCVTVVLRRSVKSGRIERAPRAI